MTKVRSILLTGSTGFIGRRLADTLSRETRFYFSAAVRHSGGDKELGRLVYVGDISGGTNWSCAVSGKQVVIHTASCVHIMQSKIKDPLSECRKVNVDGTINLARQAAEAGVKRFVFISSIGVNGKVNTQPFTESDHPNPAEPYAQSKWEAEMGLWSIQQETGMEVVIIRPPLVYGPNAPGTFGSLMCWIRKGTPLPLGAIHNKRSLVALDNLVDLIVTCIEHPAAANQVFLAGDGDDLSTTELLKGVARAMGKPSRLVPVPTSLLQLGATLVGKKAMAQRLLGSLQVDITKTREVLGWKPPITVEEGLRRCFDDSVA